jgi:sterol desaturase/sphingolipid hydroxylase (fatty acid hydroxylase superfamily)
MVGPEAPLLHSLLAAKGMIVGGWILLALAVEQWRPAAPPPLALAGYGAAWFRRWGRNLTLFALNGVLSALVVVPITVWAALHAAWSRADLLSVPAWAWLPIDLVLLDFWIYWWHRANHEWPLLWRFHEVHHRDRHLDATTALRFHFGEVAIAACVRAAVIVLLAIPLGSVIVFEILLLVATVFHHSNWRIPPALEARLARVIITPSRHWVHHHKVRTDTDSTYGTVFSFWDPLFGTTTPTRRAIPMPLGVEGRDEESLVKLIGLPIRKSEVGSRKSEQQPV